MCGMRRAIEDYPEQASAGEFYSCGISNWNTRVCTGGSRLRECTELTDDKKRVET